MGLGPRDRAIVAGQLGREPRDVTGVAVRCPFAHPAVIETAPVLSDGQPNPTLLYLTCPTMTSAISGVEAAGAVRVFKSSCHDDAELRGLLDAVTDAYRARRAGLHAQELVDPNGPPGIDPRLTAGVGGPAGPETASCLHAYAAALLAVMSGWLETGPMATRQGAARVWERFLPPLEKCWCKDERCTKWGVVARRAVVDVGTISVRLLVADLKDGRPRTVARRAEVTRLGEGLKPGGALIPAARRRTAAVVERFVQEALARGADTVLIAGTSATREAADGREFLKGLGRDLEVESVVLSGEREAESAYAGACLDVDGDPVVLDVGGGSTELTTRLKDGHVWPISLELGASRATEKWVHSDPPAAEDLAAIADEARSEIAAVRTRYGAGDTTQRLVGVAGTVTTLAALDAELQEYDPDLIHLRILTLEAVRRLASRLAGMTTAQRAALPCVQAGRAPVIVAGAVIVAAAMEALGFAELTVSERDLLDGLVMREVS